MHGDRRIIPPFVSLRITGSDFLLRQRLRYVVPDVFSAFFGVKQDNVLFVPVSAAGKIFRVRFYSGDVVLKILPAENLVDNDLAVMPRFYIGMKIKTAPFG